MPGIAPLVVRAQEEAAEVRTPLTRQGAVPSACLPGVGRFLAVLAADSRGGHLPAYQQADVTSVKVSRADSPFLGDDHTRQVFVRDARLVATEVVLPDLRNSLLVGARRGWSV